MLTKASTILSNEASKAIDLLYDTSETDSSIVLSFNDLSHYLQDTEFEKILFSTSDEIIVLLELYTNEGEIRVDFDQNIRFGIIVENNKTSQIKYIRKEAVTANTINYSFGSTSTPFTVYIILFRPEKLKNEEVKVDIQYMKEFESSKEEDVVTRNLEIPETDNNDKISVGQIMIYCLIGVGALLAIIGLFLLIRYSKNKTKPQTEEKTNISEFQGKSKYSESQNMGFMRVTSNYTNKQEFITNENE